MCVSSEPEFTSSFILEPEELQAGLSYPPNIENPARASVWCWTNCAHFARHGHRPVCWIQPEARIIGWKTNKDHNEHLYSGVKFSGIPCWIQDEQFSDWTFLGQLSSGYEFDDPLPEPNQVGCPVGRGQIGKDFKYYQPKKQRFDGPRNVYMLFDQELNMIPGWGCEGPNFGDAGLGYIFTGPTSDVIPESKFFWQCH
jgi:hypothetical protein